MKLGNAKQSQKNRYARYNSWCKARVKSVRKEERKRGEEKRRGKEERKRGKEKRGWKPGNLHCGWVHNCILLYHVWIASCFRNVSNQQSCLAFNTICSGVKLLCPWNCWKMTTKRSHRASCHAYDETGCWQSEHSRRFIIYKFIQFKEMHYIQGTWKIDRNTEQEHQSIHQINQRNQKHFQNHFPLKIWQ